MSSHMMGHSGPLESARPDEGDNGSPDSSPRPFSGANNQEQALFRIDLGRSLQMHRGLALTIAIVGTALAVAYFFRMWPVYSADSLVYVQPSPPKVLEGAAQRWPFDSVTYESYLAQEMGNVTRTDVLTAALHKLQPGVFQQSSESDQAAAERLSHAIEVTRSGSYQFTISAKAQKPDTAAQLSNAVTAAYIDSSTREEKSGDAERLTVLRAERDRVQNGLNADRAEQEDLNKQLGVAGVGGAAPDLLDDEIARTRADLVMARTDHDEAEARYTAMDAGAGTASTALDAQADQQASADAGLTSMKTALNQRRAALLTQMANLTPNHPEYKQDQVELGKINSTLDSMTKDLRTKAAQGIQQKLRTDLEQSAGVEDRLNSRLRALVGSTAFATTKMQRSSDLATDITRLQNRFTVIDEQIHNVMLEDGAPGAVFLTAAAVPPLHPAKSSALKISIVMTLFSILLGIMAAVAAHKMDDKIYIGSDVEQVLGFAPMAQWPDFREVPDEVAGEHVLRLSAALEYAHRRGGLNSCMFTGAGPGTGTSTVATRICDMLESLGRPTVMVDASGKEPPTENSRRQDSEGQPRNGRSLALLQQLAEEARMQDESLLITDSAPLALSAETEYLARSVDCAIVVIHSGVTTRAQLRATANTLQRLDVSSVGFVMNRIGLSKADAGFRNSIKDIENHLRYQKSNTGKRTMRKGYLAASNSPATAPAAEQAAARTQPAASQPASAASQAATARNEEPQSPARSSVPTPQERASAAPSSAPTSPAPAARPGIKMPAARASAQAAPKAEGEAPWWLAETAAAFQHESPTTAAPQVPEKAREPQMAQARQRQAEVAAARMQEAEEVAIRAREEEIVAARRLEAELLAARQREAAMAAEQMRRTHYAMEAAQSGETRLSGLRNVLFSVGLNNLNRTRETDYPQESGLASHPSEVATAIPETYVPYAVPAATGVTHTVTTAPEFLPPSDESARKVRIDRRDSYDEVEILPSWRGQYRRKG